MKPTYTMTTREIKDELRSVYADKAPMLFVQIRRCDLEIELHRRNMRAAYSIAGYGMLSFYAFAFGFLLVWNIFN